jgi:hypothetical protein
MASGRRGAMRLCERERRGGKRGEVNVSWHSVLEIADSGGAPQNGARAASHGDPSPPRGGSVSISGCISDTPTMISGMCPICRGTVLFYSITNS